MDFVIPADNRVKIKESEKIEKYLDLARGLKKLWNMKVTVISIVVGALGMISKGLDLQRTGRIENQKKKNQDHLDHSAVEIN